MGRNGQTACLLTRKKKKRSGKIIDASACRECFCLVFKSLPPAVSRRGRKERSGRGRNAMVGTAPLSLHQIIHVNGQFEE